MIQFYFLSIFFNVLAGLALILENEKDALEIRPGLSLKDETVRLILGILCIATGVLKILSPIEGDVLILGDLVPAVIGIASGLILVIENYKNRSSVAQAPQEKTAFNTVLVQNKKIIGYAAIVVAILHFLFPKVLFL